MKQSFSRAAEDNAYDIIMMLDSTDCSSLEESHDENNLGRSQKALSDKMIGIIPIATLLSEGFLPECNAYGHPCYKADVFDIVKLRKRIWSKSDSTKQRSKKLFNLLSDLSQSTTSIITEESNASNRSINYLIGTETVCEAAFCDAIGICRTGDMYLAIKSKVLMGVEVLVRHFRSNSRGKRGEIAMAWLQNFATQYGDPSPTIPNKIFLTHKKKKDIYGDYSKEFGSESIGSKRFQALWLLRCSNICVSSESAGFKHCSSCYTVDSRLELRSTTDHQRIFLKMFKGRHLSQQMAERAYFFAAQQISLNGGDIITMVIDAIDHRKCRLPIWSSSRTQNVTTEMQQFHKLGQSLIGARVFLNLDGPQQLLFFYVMDDLLKKDANSNIQCIHETILSLNRLYVSKGKRFPSMIQIEFDNASENKNQYVNAYISDIVRRGIFLRATSAFLYRGHTHNIIDQVFSVVSGMFRKTRIITPDEFDHAISNLLPELNTSVLRLPAIRDWNTYYTTHLCNFIKGIRVPHNVRFWKSASHCKSQFRMWSTTEWYPAGYHLQPDQTPHEKDYAELVDTLSKTAIDDGSLDESVMNSLETDLPSTTRVTNEETINHIEWMNTYPDTDSFPSYVPMKKVAVFDETLKDIEKYSKKSNSLFSADEADQLKNFINNRVKMAAATLLELRATMEWPIVVRSLEEAAIADPNTSQEDIWQQIQELGYKTLDKCYRDQLVKVRLEMMEIDSETLVVEQKTTKRKRKPAHKANKSSTPSVAAPKSSYTKKLRTSTRQNVISYKESEGDEESASNDNDD